MGTGVPQIPEHPSPQAVSFPIPDVAVCLRGSPDSLPGGLSRSLEPHARWLPGCCLGTAGLPDSPHRWLPRQPASWSAQQFPPALLLATPCCLPFHPPAWQAAPLLELPNSQCCLLPALRGCPAPWCLGLHSQLGRWGVGQLEASWSQGSPAACQARR